MGHLQYFTSTEKHHNHNQEATIIIIKKPLHSHSPDPTFANSLHFFYMGVIGVSCKFISWCAQVFFSTEMMETGTDCLVSLWNYNFPCKLINMYSQESIAVPLSAQPNSMCQFSLSLFLPSFFTVLTLCDLANLIHVNMQ